MGEKKSKKKKNGNETATILRTRCTSVANNGRRENIIYRGRRKSISVSYSVRRFSVPTSEDRLKMPRSQINERQYYKCEGRPYLGIYPRNGEIGWGTD